MLVGTLEKLIPKIAKNIGLYEHNSSLNVELRHREYPLDNEGNFLVHKSLEYNLFEINSKKSNDFIVKVIDVPEYFKYPEENNLKGHLNSIMDSRKRSILFFSLREYDEIDSYEIRRILDYFENHFKYFYNNGEKLSSTIINLEVNNLVSFLVEKLEKYHPEFKQILDDKGTYRNKYLNLIKNSAALHDVGKILMPYSLLLSSNRLTNYEFEQIKRHPEIGGKFFDGIPYLNLSRSICLNHHEHYNGVGYPCSKKGTDIPIASRIGAFADIFDALYTKRSYKRAWSEEEIISSMLDGIDIDGKGAHKELLDSLIVECVRENWTEFMEVVKKTY